MKLITAMCILTMAVAEVSALSGTVKDDKGAAISGATVALVSDTSKKAMTNAGGEFSITNVTAIHRNGGPWGRRLCIRRASPCKADISSSKRLGPARPAPSS